MKLKIMTYNIASGRCYAIDEKVTPDGGAETRLDACAEVIREISPDLCGLNEINHYIPGYVEKVGHFQNVADQTGYLAVFSGLNHSFFGKAISIEGRGSYGNAVISKYPILEAEAIGVPDPQIFDENAYYETRGITKVKLDIAGGITVLQIHVGLATAEKQNAVVELCRIIDETEGPLILMGDFNMCPDNFLLDRIRSRLTEVTPEGEGYVHTFPSWTHDCNIPENIRMHPYCKLDYIFVSHHFKPLGCRVVKSRASDHMPMIAELEI